MRKIWIAGLLLMLVYCSKDEGVEPTACFTFTANEIAEGDTMSFTNCSQNAASYLWDFGDGNSKVEFEPTHKFRSPGTYNIMLVATNNDGSDTIKKALQVYEKCKLDMENYDPTFGIDYDNPEKYLVSGEKSDLNDTYVEEIRNAIGTPAKTIAGVSTVCHWVNQDFSFVDAGGAMVGLKTVNELYESKTFYGCHSLALIISSILREFGIPAIMIETASVEWAYDYGTVNYFAGHVMSEIYIDGKWILYDNNCTYVEDYDCTNPFISTTLQYSNTNQGLFVFAKGVDMWDYGVSEIDFTHDKMVEFATNLICFSHMFNTVNYYWGN